MQNITITNAEEYVQLVVSADSEFIVDPPSSDGSNRDRIIILLTGSAGLENMLSWSGTTIVWDNFDIPDTMNHQGIATAEGIEVELWENSDNNTWYGKYTRYADVNHCSDFKTPYCYDMVDSPEVCSHFDNTFWQPVGGSPPVWNGSEWDMAAGTPTTMLFNPTGNWEIGFHPTTLRMRFLTFASPTSFNANTTLDISVLDKNDDDIAFVSTSDYTNFQFVNIAIPLAYSVVGGITREIGSLLLQHNTPGWRIRLDCISFDDSCPPGELTESSSSGSN